MSEFNMPSLGADMESGTVVTWLVKPGDQVKRGDIVCEVETQKGNIEVEVWQEGTISEICVAQGQEVPVGTTLAIIDAPGEKSPPRPAPPTQTAQPPSPEDHSADEQIPRAAKPKLPNFGVAREKRLWVSPLARRIAADKGVALAQVHGTGPHGEITRKDILTYLESSETSGTSSATGPAPTEKKTALAKKTDQRNAAMRQAIAAAMSKSKREIPHYYLKTDIDMGAALKVVDRYNSERTLAQRILPAALYIKAVAQACLRVPEMNGFWMDGSFHPSTAVHVGMGISLRRGGLVAPAIHHAEEKTITEIMGDLLDLVARARAGKLRSSEISDPTITITNLGDQGVEEVFGVIYPPQVALVGLGKISNRPFAKGDMLGVHPVLTATLAADHRASDGHRGGIFLNSIRAALSEPEQFVF